MKKLIALMVILVLGLLVVTGCETTSGDKDATQPPALPNNEVDESTQEVGENELQPPALPEG